MKVLVTEELSAAGMELLRKHFDVEERLNLNADALREALRDANAIIVRSKTQLNAQALEDCTALKVIGRAGVGYDNIDLEAASRLGVLVMNVPDGSTISACEHTFALLLSMVRHVPDAVTSMRAGKWRRDLMGHELYGKTLGVIGLGKIGFEVAKRARAFGMQPIGYDPYLSRERADAMGFPVVPLDELLTSADVLTLHVPLTDSTRKMIAKEQFEKMRKSAYIVNCARGPLIDEEALLEALSTGRIAGAALDVYNVEPPDFSSPLLSAKLPNLITTPHLGASTSEAQEKVALIIAEQVTRALVDEDYLNSVNLPRISPEMMERVRPYARVADRLASFSVQWLRGLREDVELAIEGEATKLDTEFIALGALRGFLAHVMEGQVTYVNAPILAKEKGIRITQVKRHGDTHYRSALVMTAKGDSSLVVGGTVSLQGDARLVRINDYHLDVPLAGRFVVIEHHDQPGAVGRVGTVLGNSKINIDRMEVCRSTQGKTAMMIITVDSPVPARVLDNLRELEDISNVMSIDIES